MPGTEGHPAPRAVGRYLLYGEIAAGGMATVHFGKLKGPAGFSRSVAIKKLHPHFSRDPEFVAMFLDEARLAARIFHPNVVPTLDIVQTEDELFLVMEYVRGVSLSHVHRAMRATGARIPSWVVASIMSGVLRGLHAAHEAKGENGEPLDVVHRDVSPQNILVGTDGVARVLDFGVAKAVGRAQTTRDGQLKGKLSYMAPEQLRGKEVTRRTDVYAASVVLWEALTGERLFKADNEGNMLAVILEGQITPPSEVARDVPKAFDAVVMRGLAMDPARRYGTAKDMAMAVEACGAVAPASEVGEWIEAVAAEELTLRATRVPEIDQSGSVPSAVRARVGTESDAPTRMLPEVHALESTRAETPSARDAAAAGGQEGSQISIVSVASVTGPRPQRSRRRLVVPLALLALGVATAAVVRVASRTPSVQAANQDTRSPPSATPSSSARDMPWVSPSQLPPAIAVVAASALPIAPVPRAVPGRPAPPPRPGKPKGDCNPPYTTDEHGRVHFKAACM